MSHIQSKKAIEQPNRYKYAKDQIEKLGFEIINDSETLIKFRFKETVVRFFPYTGWASGKAIKDGRGINNLLRQIK